MTAVLSVAGALDRTEARLKGAFTVDCRAATGKKCSCWKCDIRLIREALAHPKREV